MPKLTGTREDYLDWKNRSSLDSRIDVARKNLGIGSVFGLLGLLGQNTNENIAPLDDRFIDSRIKEIPQHVKDQQGYDIDRTLRTTTSGILGTLNPNRAANALAVVNAQALGAKSRLATNNAMQDIGLKNSYYDLKNASLSRYNKSVAEQINKIRNNKNSQIAGIGALGTNYYNELQKSVNRVNSFGDQQTLNSNMLNQLLPIMKGLKIQ